MANKPIDKDYLVASLKSFDEEVLSKKYSQGSGSSESIDLTNYYTKTEVDKKIEDKADSSSIPDISGLASTEYVQDVIKNKADKTDIPSLEGYVTDEGLTTALSDYAKTKDVPSEYDDTVLTERVKTLEETVTNVHTHDNKTILDQLSETDEGVLLFNGEKIQGIGESGITPHIGDNGDWYIGENDTGVPATGENGMNAYEVAVAFNGFEGTEKEWLESLKGADGISPVVNIGGNGNWFVDGVDTGVSAKGEKGDTGQGFSATKHYNTIEEMMADTEPANESEVVVVINGNIGNFYLRLSSYVDPDGITNGYLPMGNTDDIITVQGEKGEDGATPVIDINTKHWFIDGVDTGVVAEGKNGDTPYIGSNNNWFIGETDTGILAKGKDGRSIISVVKDDNNNLIITFSDGTTENAGELKVDIQGDFLTENGFGNLRFVDNKFQYYDEESKQWVDTYVTSENSYIVNLTPQPMTSFVANCNPDTMNVELKIDETNDTIVDGQTLCIVEKVIIRRKKDDFPTDENDGDLVLEIERKDFGTYKNKPYIDIISGASAGDVYCYKAFPVANTGAIANLVDNEVSCTIKDYWLFGFKLDQNESDPSSMIEYIEDNKNYNSAYMNYSTDMFDYGDWKDVWFIRDLKPCMLNYDGTVAYELDKNDYSLKADGTASDIANDSFGGNAMVGVPKVYWKIVDNGDNTANIYFSNKKVDEDFVCWSHIDNNGNEIDYCYMPIYNGSNVSSRLRSLSGKTPIYNQTGTAEITYALANNLTSDTIWYTEVFSDRMLINLLLLLIGKSTDTQAIFGTGYCTGGSQNSNPRIVTGTMNTKGLFWGNNDSSMVGVKVFGMEHWWGNQWRRIAGWINNKGTQMIKLTYGQSDGSTVDGYNTDGSGYIPIGCTLGGTSGGYVSKMTITEHGLIPTTANGSATTYYTDGLWFDNLQVDYALVGSACSYGFLVGSLCVNLAPLVSFTSWAYGASISCKPLATT